MTTKKKLILLKIDIPKMLPFFSQISIDFSIATFYLKRIPKENRLRSICYQKPLLMLKTKHYFWSKSYIQIEKQKKDTLSEN